MAQNGKCAICDSDYGGHRNGEQKALAVDHCHTTNKVRGLLCEPCNQAIGKLQDSAEICRRAANYLEKHSADTSAESDLGPLALQTDLADAAQTSGRTRAGG